MSTHSAIVGCALLLCAAGCTRTEEPAAAGAPLIAAGMTGAALATEPSAYQVSLNVSAELTVGVEGDIEARIAAKKGFHVNPDYPVNFKPDPSETVKFALPRAELKDGDRTACAEHPDETCELRSKVKLTATAAGFTKASGVLAFSVCNPERCLIEKVPVSVTLEARAL